MKKNILRLLSAAMCLIMVLGLMGGCSAPETEPDAALDGDEHDEDTSDLIVDLGAEEKTPLAGGTCNGRHSWDNGHWETNANFCAFSKCDAFVKNCTVCGAKTYIAFRNTDSTGGKSQPRAHGTAGAASRAGHHHVRRHTPGL